MFCNKFMHHPQTPAIHPPLPTPPTPPWEFCHIDHHHENIYVMLSSKRIKAGIDAVVGGVLFYQVCWSTQWIKSQRKTTRQIQLFMDA